MKKVVSIALYKYNEHKVCVLPVIENELGLGTPVDCGIVVDTLHNNLAISQAIKKAIEQTYKISNVNSKTQPLAWKSISDEKSWKDFASKGSQYQ